VNPGRRTTATEWQRIWDWIEATFIFARSDFVNVCGMHSRGLQGLGMPLLTQGMTLWHEHDLARHASLREQLVRFLFGVSPHCKRTRAFGSSLPR
jgi:hypothetical protein